MRVSQNQTRYITWVHTTTWGRQATTWGRHTTTWGRLTTWG
jgi:hypothetical protein